MRNLPPLAVAIIAFVAVGCGKGNDLPDLPTPTPQTGKIIATINFSQLPTLRVKVGSVVSWRNRDEELAHTATADDESWDTGPIQEGRVSGEVMFTKVGSFKYHCELFPSMKATVQVVE